MPHVHMPSRLSFSFERGTQAQKGAVPGGSLGNLLATGTSLSRGVESRGLGVQDCLASSSFQQVLWGKPGELPSKLATLGARLGPLTICTWWLQRGGGQGGASPFTSAEFGKCCHQEEWKADLLQPPACVSGSCPFYCTPAFQRLARGSHCMSVTSTVLPSALSFLRRCSSHLSHPLPVLPISSHSSLFL